MAKTPASAAVLLIHVLQAVVILWFKCLWNHYCDLHRVSLCVLMILNLQTVIFTGGTCFAAIEKRDRYPSWRSTAHSERDDRNSVL